MRYAQLVATGRYVPSRRVTNADLEAQLGPGIDTWLRENVGIEARHVMGDDEHTSTMATHAAQDALARAGLDARAIDLIVLATDTPDQPSPATATAVQHALGARNAAAFDVNCACASFVTSVEIAARLVEHGGYQRALVIGAYGMTRFLDPRDKKTCTLFADAASAIVIAAGDRPGVLTCKLETAGEYHDALGIYGGGTARPSTLDNVRQHGAPRVEFVRKFPATFNTERWPRLVSQVLAPHAMTPRDVSLYVFTQLNLRTIEATMEALELPLERTHWTMDRYGYTGSACIPLTLDDAVRRGRLREGDHVVLCATGGGMSLACALMKWTVAA